MKPVILILIFTILLFPVFAWAVEWESLVKTQDSELFVDLDSYDEHDAYSSIMAKVTANPPKTGNQADGMKQVVTKQMILEFDCKRHSYRALGTSFYGTNEGFLPLSRDKDTKTIASLVCQVRQMVNPQ
ncbi:hypothetical protein LG200_07120 [Methylobacillus caricis]|uniref:surface-adhesin E family protein n=1 Tax=Methylobacillus caricis TaxID=1971611 RepID=UPI001CFF9AD2|nr:surface-adhesin E family protein [Methylobacillus caricis]MCB5187776.1 hypothetical protein [Methylobacillus caricis]